MKIYVNRRKNKEDMKFWISVNFHRNISWTVDMNMRKSEVMMSSPHNFNVFRILFWKLSFLLLLKHVKACPHIKIYQSKHYSAYLFRVDIRHVLLSKFDIFLIFHPIYVKFPLFCSKNLTLSSEIKLLNLFRISPLILASDITVL